METSSKTMLDLITKEYMFMHMVIILAAHTVSSFHPAITRKTCLIVVVLFEPHDHETPITLNPKSPRMLLFDFQNGSAYRKSGG